MTLILCARVSWPVPAVRGLTEKVARKGGVVSAVEGTSRCDRPELSPFSVSPWRCSWCGARVKVVA